MTSIFDSSGITATRFLETHWQKEPLLLRQALPGFEPALDADDIAGLACEDLAQSRLVSGRYPGSDWTVRYGPFEEVELAALPERDWTLLVQDVEKHYPPLQELMAKFDFLPRWRVDDLMVSVAAPGGSVGPHVDQYDVFLLQASGRRRWQIARHFDPELRAGCELPMLQRFEAESEWVLEPGDLLYLPPGIAHFGVAEPGNGTSASPCMTWSIGMRAPSAADLLQACGEWLADCANEGRRYTDADLAPNADPSEIDAASVDRFDALLRSALEDPRAWRSFLGSFLSSYRMAHEPAPPGSELATERLAAALTDGARIRPHPWTRLLWTRDGEDALLFAGGESLPCSREAARAICDPAGLGADDLQRLSGAGELVSELLRRGHLVLETV
jgi:50S ribosomal protein L16 3-hydroxylase